MTASGTLEGRVAIVTGGARGIGAAICEELIDRGASVIVADNGVEIDGRGADPSVAEEFADMLGERGRAYTQDMSVPKAAREVVEMAVEEFGGLDIVVNNAAILRDSFIFKSSADDFDAVLRTNLSSAYYLLGAATPVMRDQAKAGRGVEDGTDGSYDWGRVINVVSSVAFYGNYGQSGYAAAKAGLTALTRVVALDMARSGVTSNALVPFAHTRVTEAIKPTNEMGEQYKERMLRIPPKHVAGLAGYLCTDPAKGISGQILGVRGKEIFLYTAPRPVARVLDPGNEWDDAFFERAIERELKDHFGPMITDLEVYNTDPAL